MIAVDTSALVAIVLKEPKADACVAFSELTTKFPSAPDSVTTRLKEEKRRYACR